MITIVCPECKTSVKVMEDDKSSMEINMGEKAIYFKCSFCKKTSDIKLYKEDKPLPRIISRK